MTFQDPKHAEKCSRRAAGQPIGELEALLAKDRDSAHLMIPFPPEIEAMLMRAMRPYSLQPLLHVSTASVAGILDTVRNTILNWALKLEEDGIVGDNLTFSEQERSQASSVPYHVTNFYGPVMNSQVAAGAANPVQVSISAEIDTREVRELLAKIKEAAEALELPSEARDELQSEIATVEAQVDSPKPKSGIIRESFATIRRILEGAGGSALGGLLESIAKAVLG